MTTKEKILETALRLFNERGVDAVTVRTIAQEVGISHGNLCYHYPNTDAIISNLYQQLADRITLGINRLAPDTVTIAMCSMAARATFSLLHDYRFMMLDFAGIMRRIPALREQHQALMAQRKQAFKQVLTQLRKGDLLLPELFPGHDVLLLEQLFVIGDFWLSSASILYGGPPDEAMNHYQQVFEALLFPLMTDEGRRQWLALENR